MIDRTLWERFYMIYSQYRRAWTKYWEGEFKFDLDMIGDELIPILLRDLFVAWFPMLEDFIIVDESEHRGFDAYEYSWDDMDVEELYCFFETGQVNGVE